MGHPTYMYRRNDKGGIDAQIFDSDDLPEGWVDHPDKVEKPIRVAGATSNGPNEPTHPVTTKPGRKKK